MTKLLKKKNIKNSGQMLVMALIVTGILLVLSGAMMTFSSREYLNSTGAYRKTQAVNLAEAGVEKAIQELSSNPNYTGTGGSTVALSGGEFEVTVTGSEQARNITAIGYVPDKLNYKAKKTVKVSVSISTLEIPFDYAIQSDVGGLDMKANSEINGNVYTNGSITGAANSRIYGDASAVGTISSPRPTVSGTKTEGSPSLPLQTIDLNFWKNEATDGGTYEGNYIVSESQEIGPLKINGDLIINSNLSLTINGPVYITGNFTMNSNTNLYLKQSFGSSGTIVVLDGKFKIESNGIIHPTSANPQGYILIASTNTADDAIYINSNSSNGLCYSPNGGIILNSNALVTSITGKKITLESNAEINYDLGLSNAVFTSSPGGGWLIQKGTWVEH